MFLGADADHFRNVLALNAMPSRG